MFCDVTQYPCDCPVVQFDAFPVVVESENGREGSNESLAAQSLADIFLTLKRCPPAFGCPWQGQSESMSG